MKDEILKKLDGLKEAGYQKFSASLIPGCGEMLGVRIPRLRSLAKEIAKGPRLEEYLGQAPGALFEEKLLRGLVIGYAGFSFERFEKELQRFLPYVDNWSVCDSTVMTCRIFSKQREKGFALLSELSRAQQLYYRRFAAVALMSYYLKEDFIKQAADLIVSIRAGEYYVDMAIAWAIATAAAKDASIAAAMLQSPNLNSFTVKKALQKCRESRRVADETVRTLSAKSC